MPFRGPLGAFALFLCFAASQPAGAAEIDAPAFERGVAAFGSGDYEAALRWFVEARTSGLDTPGLRYDLGATYYRLQRYAEAEVEFASLARDPDWAALASYNLGLIAQRTGRVAQAREYFQEALRTTTDADLRALAAKALGRLELAQPTRVVAVASLAAGYDSNATLTPDAAIAGTSHQGDFFAESLGGLSYRLLGNAASTLTAQGGFLVRKYLDLHEFDQTGFRLGLSHETASAGWLTFLGGFYDTIYFGGDPFQRAAVVEGRVTRRLGASELRGRYEYQHIEGGSGFEYLDGWQQQLTLDAGFASGAALTRVGYELELNDRRDLQQGADFLSFSPTRHTVFASVLLPNIGGGWGLEARGGYRFSRYNDPYVLNGEQITREDRRYGVALHASRRISGPWRFFVDYSGYRNDSTIDVYDYTRYQAMAGIEIVIER